MTPEQSYVCVNIKLTTIFSGFPSIPTTLNPDMQTLIMDGNPLGGLDKDAFKSANLLNLQKISLKGCDIRYEIKINKILTLLADNFFFTKLLVTVVPIICFDSK